MKIVIIPKRWLFFRHTLPIFLGIHQVFLRQIGFVWRKDPSPLGTFPIFKQRLVSQAGQFLKCWCGAFSTIKFLLNVLKAIGSFSMANTPRHPPQPKPSERPPQPAKNLYMYLHSLFQILSYRDTSNLILPLFYRNPMIMARLKINALCLYKLLKKEKSRRNFSL